MKYLITGYKGQLGYDIARELRSRNEKNIICLDKEEMDITNEEQVNSLIQKTKPDVIFHCAAYTNVDKAEDDEENCYKINVLGTKYIAQVAKEIGAKLVYISSDYVFDGTKIGMYSPDDKVNPMSVYGKTKFLGEEEARRNSKSFIVRTSWVFGINGNNFIKTMLNLAETKDEISVVSDQIGSPTYTVDLANLLVNMVQTENYGTYHANNTGYCSWAEFADYIFESNNKNAKVNFVTSIEYATMINKKQAYRPMNSRLSKSCLVENGFELLPTWEDAVDRYNKELQKIKTKRK